jgi:HlyD family secretion protein/adhesin transport system membrane fusion protein
MSSRPAILPLASRAAAPEKHILALEEVRSGQLERGLLFGGGLLVLGFLLWATLTRLPELVLAPGEVVTILAAAPVQHLEGGIVETVLVTEGARVAADAPILRMNGTAARADLGQSRTRAAALRLQRERLNALVEGGALPDEGLEEILGAQRAALAARLRAQANRVATLHEQIAARRSEINTLIGQRRAHSQQIDVLRDELSTRQGLARDGLSTRVAVLEMRRLLLAAEAERDRTEGQIVTARIAVAEVEARIDELKANAIDDARHEAARVTQELAEVEETIQRLEDRVERTLVRAPGAGTVRGLTVTRAGGVVQPGQLVAEILPDDAALVVDARVDPRDIGFVRVGQSVTVKVMSFDFSRFGTVPGAVERVSAGSFSNEQRQPYYKVRIALEREHLGHDPARTRLVPGMTTQVDITIGGKSVLEYLLKPLYASMSTAFRER